MTGQVLTLLYDEDGLGDVKEEDDEKNWYNEDDTWPWGQPTFHKSRREK